MAGFDFDLRPLFYGLAILGAIGGGSVVGAIWLLVSYFGS